MTLKSAPGGIATEAVSLAKTTWRQLDATVRMILATEATNTRWFSTLIVEVENVGAAVEAHDGEEAKNDTETTAIVASLDRRQPDAVMTTTNAVETEKVIEAIVGDQEVMNVGASSPGLFLFQYVFCFWTYVVVKHNAGLSSV